MNIVIFIIINNINIVISIINILIFVVIYIIEKTFIINIVKQP
jgi:hypothetical protein